MSKFHPSNGSRERLCRLAYVLLPPAALTAYFLIWDHAPVLRKDSSGYLHVARDIVENVSLTELHFRTPGYPALLVLTNSSVTPTRALFLASLMLYMASVYAVLSLLRKSGFRSSVILLCCLIALTPPAVEHTAFVLTETMCGFFLVGAVWLLAQPKRAGLVGGAAGAAIGCAALTRPTYQLLGLAVALTLLLLGQKKRALLILTVSTLVVGTLVVYNFARFGYFGLTPAIGWNLSTRTATFVERTTDERARSVLVAHRNARLLTDMPNPPVLYMMGVDVEQLSRETGLRGNELANYMLKVNLRLILSNPVSYLNEVGKAFITYWLPASGELAGGNSELIRRAWILLHFCIVLLFWAQSVAVAGTSMTHGLRVAQGGVTSTYVLGTLVIFYTTLISCFIDVGHPRFRVPTDLLILLTTFLGLRIWHHERSASRGERGTGMPGVPHAA